MQPAYKVVQTQGMSAYSVQSPGPDSCLCIGISIGETRLYGFLDIRAAPAIKIKLVNNKLGYICI